MDTTRCWNCNAIVESGIACEDCLSLDGCEICEGSRGGIKGNENVVDGVVMCDYCHADQITNTPTN